LINKNNIKYLHGIDTIYWLNLEVSTSRKNNMLNMFKNDIFKNINIERINAVNGKLINLKDFIQVENKNNSMSYSEFGCLLTHLDTIRKFSNSKYNIALILEDDCTLDLKKYWKKSINKIIQEAPSDWGIIQLCYYTNDMDSILDWNNNNILYHKWNNHYSTLAYLINKKSANNFINKYYINNIYSLDYYQSYCADNFIYNNIKTYVYKFPYFIQLSNNDSNIHTDHLLYHEQCKNIIINKYKNNTNNI
jgi:GR25 family glycosyltransferase involved in LPS biosynthesis